VALSLKATTNYQHTLRTLPFCSRAAVTHAAAWQVKELRDDSGQAIDKASVGGMGVAFQIVCACRPLAAFPRLSAKLSFLAKTG